MPLLRPLRIACRPPESGQGCQSASTARSGTKQSFPSQPSNGCACGCVVAGTLVATPEGLVAIETLEVGDMVLAYDPKTDAVVPQPVLDVIRTEPKPTYNVVLRAASGETAQFEATDDHPWLNVAKEWRNTEDLAVGDRLVASDGERFEVIEVGLTGNVEVAYTLTVDKLHTYIMGEVGIVVHNAKCKPPKKTPNTVENKSFKDAIQGLGLTKAQQRTLHDEITGQGMDFHEIRALAVELFGK